MFHLHKFVVVRDAHPNAYKACRCGERKIVHRDLGRPMNYDWLRTGTFRDMPLGPST